MNAVGSSTNQTSLNSATSHWLPSHVQITIHQARELHLKSKSGHSELYVSLQVDKERFLSSSLPKQLTPHWNERFEIPLMSLANTIHITVRQKGRFGDSYLGYIPVNPGSFKISPDQVTHWHKLGAKPGKSSTKLRGELQVTFQFLSKWSSRVDAGDGSADHKGMLKRSSSDLKLQPIRHTDLDEGMVVGKPNQLKNRREILVSLRRSFRRKPRSPAVQNCEDDFTLFSSQSASSTPQNIRRGTIAAISYTAPDNTSNSFSSTGYASNGMSDSDTGNSSSHSPPSVRSGKGLSTSESRDKALGQELKEKEVVVEDALTPDGNMTATKFYNFRSKKRPWDVHTLPNTTPPPANTPVVASEKPLGQTQGTHEEEGEEEETKTSQPDEEEVTTFKYKSRASVLSRSFRSHESAASRMAAFQQRTSESSLEPTANKPYEEDQESEPRPFNRYRQASLSEESSTCTSTEGSKTELNGPGAETNKREELVKSPPNKSHPYSRRIDISPRTISPTSNQRSRPKILAYGKADPEGRMAKTGPALLTRRSTLSSIHPKRRILPAPPMRRGTITAKPVLQHANSSSPSSKKSTPPPPNVSNNTSIGGGSDAVNSFATKLVNSLETVASKEKLLQENAAGDETTSEGVGVKEQLHTTPCGSTSSINSKEEIGNSRVKHTVQYNNSAFFSKGFQPVTLLPPSLQDYTTRSQTLPVRGKFSKRHSNSTQALYSDDTPLNQGEGVASDKSPSLTKLGKTENSPPNTRHTPQALMDHISSRSPSSPPFSSPSLNTAISETDGDGSVITRDANLSNLSTVKQKYAGKTPGEIVTGAMRNRKPVGGLKKAMTLYQVSRRQSQSSRRGSEDVRGASEECSFTMKDSDRLHLVQSAGSERTSYSERSSPRSSRAGRFTSLRRTRSHFFTSHGGDGSTGSKPHPQSPGDSGSEDQPDSTTQDGTMTAPLLNRTPQSGGSKITSAPGLLMRAKQELSEEEEDVSTTSEVLIRVRTATMTSADSSSLHTLTDANDSMVVKEQRFSPNPAGAGSAAGSHVRHTTCSSVESEGFHSVNSEEMSLEDMMHQDWSQWSKQELVKELISCKEKLGTTEERLANTDNQLKEIRSYMDNLLLRIMDTNPSILSANPQQGGY